MSLPAFIPKEHCHSAFDRTFPATMEVDSGTVVTFETHDAAYRRLWDGESPDNIAGEEFNLVTGPLVVRGAEPGGAIRIDILDITIDRIWGVWLPGYGPLGKFTDRVQIQPLTHSEREVQISDRLSVPLAPMIGCIGVAPAEGSASTLEPAYPFGGNLDLRELSTGASLWLPVQTAGAYLSIGDLHAAMGDGETTWMSLEAAGRATVRVSTEKDLALKSPRIKTRHETICVAVFDCDATHEEAVESAAQQAFEYLTTVRGFTPFEAYLYTCARVSLRFGGPASPIVLAVIPDE